MESMGRTETIHRVVADHVEAFIADDGQTDVCYCYGGVRSVGPDTSDHEVVRVLCRLRDGESRLKNSLINSALSQSILSPNDLVALPQGLIGSRVGGARAIFRARNPWAFSVLQDPQHADFEAVVVPLFERLGSLLNDLGGRIKLTPDFGRFANVSDLLAQFTDHVLGIAREKGGCGGKASYTVSGIIAALEIFDPLPHESNPLTLIGSNGALGRGLLQHFQSTASRPNLAICDLAYESTESPAAEVAIIASCPGRFTDEAIGRGGTIIATTVGGELEASNLAVLQSGTRLILAHNLAVPDGDKGTLLMREIASLGVVAVNGA